MTEHRSSGGRGNICCNSYRQTITICAGRKTGMRAIAKINWTPMQ